MTAQQLIKTKLFLSLTTETILLGSENWPTEKIAQFLCPTTDFVEQ